MSNPTSIGERVSAARFKANQTVPQFAKTLKITQSMLRQIEYDRPTGISEKTQAKLKAARIIIPNEQLTAHNQLASTCTKAKRWDKAFVAHIEGGGSIETAPRHKKARRSKVAKKQSKQTKMKHVSAKKVHLAPVKIRKPAVKAEAPPISKQGFIPGFLDQQTNGRLNEMITDYVFKRLQERLEQKLDEIFSGRKHG